MNPKIEEIVIKGEAWVRKDAAKAPAEKLDGMNYVVVRSRDAGCHAGYLKEDNETSVVLIRSRRLWYWEGAASLSQLAMDGVANPGNCKFPCEVDEIKIINHCEIIKTTDKARISLMGVPEWKK